MTSVALLAEQGGEVKTTFRQNMIPNLLHGLLAEGSPGAGSLFPQPAVRHAGTGRSVLLDDLTGSRVRVVASTAPLPQETEEFDKRLAPLDGCIVSLNPADGTGLCVRDTSGCLDAWMSELGCTFVFVRPDHYVYATARSAAEALRHLDSLCTELQIGCKERL